MKHLLVLLENFNKLGFVQELFNIKFDWGCDINVSKSFKVALHTEISCFKNKRQTSLKVGSFAY